MLAGARLAQESYVFFQGRMCHRAAVDRRYPPPKVLNIESVVAPVCSKPVLKAGGRQLFTENSPMSSRGVSLIPSSVSLLKRTSTGTTVTVVPRPHPDTASEGPGATTAADQQRADSSALRQCLRRLNDLKVSFFLSFLLCCFRNRRKSRCIIRRPTYRGLTVFLVCDLSSYARTLGRGWQGHLALRYLGN